MDLLGFFGFRYLPYLTLAMALGPALVHIVFAFGVYRASSRLSVHFAPRLIWSLATLMGGVFVAGVFWLMHLSTLAPQVRVTADEPIPDPPRLLSCPSCGSEYDPSKYSANVAVWRCARCKEELPK